MPPKKSGGITPRTSCPLDYDTTLDLDEWRKKQLTPPSRAVVVKIALYEFFESHPTKK